jgi:thymidine kinase
MAGPGEQDMGRALGGREPAGSIELVTGPMFSGKTSELLSRVRRAALAGQAVLLVKFRGDTRGAGDAVETHAEARQGAAAATDEAAAFRVVVADALGEVAVTEPVVGVDEGQFFPDLPEVCERWAGAGRRVIVAALDADASRRPFGRVGELAALCERAEKRDGVCMDCRAASAAFTRRLAPRPPAEPGAIRVDIGGRELYRCVCRRCWLAAGPPLPELKDRAPEEPPPAFHMAHGSPASLDQSDLSTHVKRAINERRVLFGVALNALRNVRAGRVAELATLERALNDSLPSTTEDRTIAALLQALASAATPGDFHDYLGRSQHLGLVLLYGDEREVARALGATDLDIWRADGRFQVTRRAAEPSPLAPLALPAPPAPLSDGAPRARGPRAPRRADMDGRRADMDGRRADMDGRRADMDGRRPDADGRRADGRRADGRRSGADGHRPDTDGRPPSSAGRPPRRRRRGGRRTSAGLGFGQQVSAVAEMERAAHAAAAGPSARAASTEDARAPSKASQDARKARSASPGPASDARALTNGADSHPDPEPRAGPGAQGAPDDALQDLAAKIDRKTSWAELADELSDPEEAKGRKGGDRRIRVQLGWGDRAAEAEREPSPERTLSPPKSYAEAAGRGSKPK